MSSKSTHKTPLQWLGLLLFSIALVTFTAIPTMDKYELTETILTDNIGNEYHQEALLEEARAQQMFENEYGSSFSYTTALKGLFAGAKERINARIEAEGVPEGQNEWDVRLADWVYSSSSFSIIKASNQGAVRQSPWVFFLLTIGLAVLGGILYVIPKFSKVPGIKHDHIYHSALTRGLKLGWRSLVLAAVVIGVLGYGVYYMGQDWFWPGITAAVAGIIAYLVLIVQQSLKNQDARSASPELASAWLGIFAGLYLVSFYVFLYWSPQHITGWVHMVNPLSEAISGNGASQWFLYGLLYTVVMWVMGVRMIAKYRHNRYQMIRTSSVIFFQTAFAFLLPEILVRLNQPWYDFKNIWPLDYDFFFGWQLDQFQEAGSLGMFMLVWGIILIVVAVPLITYFYGKRWYCSWVCGCGGLAETLGDPFRQLSDKSLRAWEFERFIIHGVLVFAVIMTGLTLYTYFSGSSEVLGLKTDSVQKWYGFMIGAGFAGVVGTGFYPLMGNRVWCRFGCPLAAYLGIVQRFKSRFRITTNGGQCISCGNCSTYCEMGIDVRHYAQRGQDIVRSSCVGCGVCAAVCPRGVLRLENSSMDVSTRTDELRVIQVKEEEVGIL